MPITIGGKEYETTSQVVLKLKDDQAGPVDPIDPVIPTEPDDSTPPIEPPPIENPDPNDDVDEIPTDLPDIEVITGTGALYFEPENKPATIDEMVANLRPTNERMFSTPELVALGANKLGSEKYDFLNYFLENDPNPAWQALNYRLTGDLDKGVAARNALMAGNPGTVRGSYLPNILSFAATYSWISDLFDNENDKLIAIEANVAKITDYGVLARQQYMLNDAFAKGPAHRAALALVLAGDHEPSTQQTWMAYNTHKGIESSDGTYKGVFSPFYHGALGTAQLLAHPNGGGDRAGCHNVAHTGYDFMFFSGMFPMLVWQFAFGENIYNRTNYFSDTPKYLAYAYLHQAGMSNASKLLLEINTTLSTDPIVKGVSRWLADNSGVDDKGNYRQLMYLAGDRDVEPIHPEDSGYPLFGKASNQLVVRSSFQPDALIYTVHSRDSDIFRYEPDTGSMSVTNKGRAVLCRSSEGKGGYKAFLNSGLLISNPDGRFYKVAGRSVYGSQYWHKIYNQETPAWRTVDSSRPNDPEWPQYWPNNTEVFDGNNIVVEGANCLSFAAPDAVIRRHVWRDGDSLFIKDNLEGIPEGVVIYHNLRIPTNPVIDGPVVNFERATAYYPPFTMPTFIGGEGKEMLSPWDVWLGNKKAGVTPGYSSKEAYRERWGFGSLIAPIVLVDGAAEFIVKLELT